MSYFTSLLGKAIKSMIVTVILIMVLWGTLYHLTDLATVTAYFWTGVTVCFCNALIANLRAKKIKNLIIVQGSWVIMAGLVLVLYHAGFVTASVFVAAAIFASPFFWASIYESFVGLTLLITLARLISN